jgi:2-polyprenyl-3-methyl-5-hydroxy-6-metoxy-1,4-benzoquinol methylase
MPTSQFTQISVVVNLIRNISPKSILDIGIGYGKYGFLSREYLELHEKTENYSERNITIEGVEIFEEYLTPVHHYIYDKIHIGNAIDIVSSLEQHYDLALMVDVLEHFSYQDGINLLDSLVKKVGNIIISVPKDIGEQGSYFDNPYEKHEFQWQHKHFKKYSPIFFYNGQSLILCISDRKSELKKKLSDDRKFNCWMNFKINLKYYLPFLKPLYKKIFK